MKVELDLPNQATKADLKMHASDFAKPNLKSDVAKLKFDKLKDVPSY